MAAMSNFALSPATLQDLPGIAKVSRAAFMGSRRTMSYWMFSREHEEEAFVGMLDFYTKIFRSESHCTFIKLVDTTVGKIVAFALWEAPHPPETEEEKAKKEQEKRESGDKHDALPRGTNVRLYHDFNTETKRMRAKYVHSEKDYSE